MFAVEVLPKQMSAFALLFDSIPVQPMAPFAGRLPLDRSRQWTTQCPRSACKLPGEAILGKRSSRCADVAGRSYALVRRASCRIPKTRDRCWISPLSVGLDGSHSSLKGEDLAVYKISLREELLTFLSQSNLQSDNRQPV